MERIAANACFGGTQEVWQHASNTLGVPMKFGVYLPPQARTRPCPVLWFLSGLTCTEQNVITKGGFQRACAEHGIIFIAPDTSPRGDDVPDDPAYDLGQGAGFYLNATQAPWATHYRMYDYVVDELPALVNARFPTNGRQGITGHSMGGHGAIVIALRNPGRYQSGSAFAPITSPSEVPWGRKAFGAYLGADEATWAQYDASGLLESATERLPLLIDQGMADQFLEEQLVPERFEQAARKYDHPLELRRQPGYDHSYYFIASFAADHVAHHARALNAD